MTFAPLKQNTKEQFLNILNLPETIPGKLLRILGQNTNERPWEDVETLQKATWNVSDNRARAAIDKAVTDSYNVRYGTEPIKRDFSGRQIMNDVDWTPNQNSENKKLSALALRMRPLARSEDNASIFRGIERGINILLGKKSPHVKVCGGFDDKTQNVFQNILNQKPYPDIFQAVKTGMITDALLCYENRNLSADEKKKKVRDILGVFNKNPAEDEEQEFALYDDTEETPPERNNPEPTEADIQQVIWNSTDSCGDCAQHNGKTFNIDDLPTTHPNCLCTLEPLDSKQPYMRIYIKDNVIGHVRIEIVDENGQRTIRGLNQHNLDTIYEKGENDSSGISVNDKEYIASPKIFLTRKAYYKAAKRIEELDKSNPEYNPALNNCDDFVNDIIQYCGFENKNVGDFISDEQERTLSHGSDIIKYQLPRSIGYPNKNDAPMPDLMDDEEGNSQHEKKKLNTRKFIL